MLKIFAILLSILGFVTTIGQYASAAMAGNIAPVVIKDDNVMLITIKICVPGTNNCSTIPNVRVDSGSSGLILFYAEDLPPGLPKIENRSGDSLGRCAHFAGNLSLWGPMLATDVVIGGTVASQVPVSVNQPDFNKVPASCKNVGPVKTERNARGILGIGKGVRVAATGAGKTYYSCGNGGCVPCPVSPVNLNDWSTCSGGFPESPLDGNPIAFMPPGFNNGWIIKFPEKPTPKGDDLNGSLVLGIGTQPNNTPSTKLTVIPIDSQGFMRVKFQGQTYRAVLDTGSPGWLFPTPLLDASGKVVPRCTGAFKNFYCPTSPVPFHGVLSDSADSPDKQVPFDSFIVNPSQINNAFDGLGYVAVPDAAYAGIFSMSVSYFMGRNVYYGIAGKTVPGIGVGPFNAFEN